MTINTDSYEYNILENAARAVKGIPGCTVEIGLRAGGGTAYIMRALIKNGDFGRNHIAIDPYGNIPYESHDGVVERLDYTNTMKNVAMMDLYEYVKDFPINFIFMPFTDTFFMETFKNGVEIYSETTNIVNEYALVHFDGPHSYAALQKEVEFFATRAPSGAQFVFDDISYYDHNKLETESIFSANFTLVEKGKTKARYIKQ